MNVSQKYLTELANCAIFSHEPPEPPEGIDWKYIFDKASEQNISGLLSDVVLKLPKEKQPENADAWKAYGMMTMMHMSARFCELERMLEVLKTHGIHPVCLKGSVIKDLYPVPELRTMGDFDIWIDKSEQAKADEIFKAEGYLAKKNAFLINYSKTDAHWEVFTSLEEEFDNQSAYWDKKLREKVVTDSNGKHVLEPTYELIYVIAHMSKHFFERGCGIRNLLDIALIIESKKNDIDFDTVYASAKKLGIGKVFEYILDAMEKYFGVITPIKVHTKNTEAFMEYILSYGIFGKECGGELIIGRMLYKDSNALRALFPSVRMLKNDYPYLEKSKFLLPVAWIDRTLRCIFVKKKFVPDVLRGLRIGTEAKREQDAWLDKMGL